MTPWTALLLIPVVGLALVLLFCVWLLVASIGQMVIKPGSRTWLYVVALYAAAAVVTVGLAWQKVIEPGWVLRCVAFGLPVSFLIVVGITFLTTKSREQPEESGD